jgi:dCMP deaminase
MPPAPAEPRAILLERRVRPTWDEYFMLLAGAAATRSTCLKRQVGCVVVRDKMVVATGYNGSAPGEPHCLDVGCELVGGKCVRTAHAEANAAEQLRRRGSRARGAVAYCTRAPCEECLGQLGGVGVIEVVSPLLATGAARSGEDFRRG